jgi:2-hydroxymuconate-semialdehyde hydrolase
MGSAGLRFQLTEGLDRAWGYTPSIDKMRALLDVFAYDRSLVTDELARMRFEASIRPGYQEAFASMFPAPRQRWVDALASDESDIRAIRKETLIIHGREDRVIPLASSYRLAELIDHAQLHVFGRCGHWTQIEHAVHFNRLVSDFLAESC